MLRKLSCSTASLSFITRGFFVSSVKLRRLFPLVAVSEITDLARRKKGAESCDELLVAASLHLGIRLCPWETLGECW